MTTYLLEEEKKLAIILEKLQDSFDKLDKKALKYADEVKESMQYLWENKTGMDSMEIFSNQRSITQIANAGDFTVERRTTIERLIDSPYFARIDFLLDGDKEADQLYVGRFSYMDDDDNMLIYDWRAPICSMYYDFELGPAFYEAPAGSINGELTLKRQFKIKNSSMVYALESSISINDEVLQRELSHTSDLRMKNIVATIQKEQNKIIRNESAEVLVIQGAAGSGKTSIALHRAAFLLYKYRDRLSAKNIVIISPNRVFADYISNVLPELGEEPITEVEFEDIAEEHLDHNLEFEGFAELIEKLLEENDPERINRIQFKSSKEFLCLLEEYLEYGNDNFFRPSDYTFGRVCVSKDFLQERYDALKRYSIAERFDEIAENIIEKVRTEGVKDGKLPGKKQVMKTLFLMFRFDNTLDFYEDFYKHINRPDLFAFKSKNKLEYDDVFPYLYVKIFLDGIKKFQGVKHVVIDEMQDYTYIQYAVIKKLFPCKKTILGDFGQIVNPYNSCTLESFQELFEKVECVELYKSYRSTYEIIQFSQKIKNKNVDPIQRHGDEPEVISCNDLNSELEAINKLLTDFKNSSFSSLGILCKTKRQAKELYDMLSKTHRINLLDFDSLKFSDGITITSIHMSKGLEFDEVVIPTASFINYKSEYDRDLLYIACTRAMHKLTLTYHGKKTSLLP